jgi:predicted NAD/FAD-binding protein
MKIAVVGSGISGLGAALALSEKHEVFLFEKNSYFGGHSNTVKIELEEETTYVDTGFIVFNEKNYPNLVGLFNELAVVTKCSNMSFGFSLDEGRLEYAGINFNSFFAQRKNLLSLKHLRGLYDIFRFKKIAEKFMLSSKFQHFNMRQFLEQNHFGNWFSEMFIVPMGAAIWSVPTGNILDFPASSYLKFFQNHSLLDLITTQIEWRTVDGGSKQYVDKIIEKLGESVFLETPVIAIRRKNKKCLLHAGNGFGQMIFDKVVLACDGPQTRELIADITKEEEDILKMFKVSENRVVLHSDETHMPKMKRVWSSWNFITDNITSSMKKPIEVTYWMNKLQNINSKNQYFVSLNPSKKIEPNLSYYETSYSHPIYDSNTLNAQTKLNAIQGNNGLYFAGAKMGFGFHEDGLNSGLKVAKLLGCEPSWSVRKI